MQAEIEEWGEGYGSTRYWKKYSNLALYHVDKNLPTGTYLVLQDGGLQVKANYDQCKTETIIKKVGLELDGERLILHANGKVSIGGKIISFEMLDTFSFTNAQISVHRKEMHVKYGVYSVFLKLKTEDKCQRIGVKVGVSRDAKVNPSGFIGERIAVNPANYITSDITA